MDSQPQLLAQLLQSWCQGRQGAIDELVPMVYDDLRRLAHRYMAGERPGHTLQTTALVNEAYLRLAGSVQGTREDRIHFFAACSRSMRQILVDSARTRQALKRGGEVPQIELQEALAVAGQPSADLVAIDDALNALAAIDARKSQVVELRFFGGLSVQETAEVLKVSVETVHRDWRLAKSWLRRELSREQAHGR
jgi:RNA polymerase sigma factor (TIGR02999 family)